MKLCVFLLLAASAFSQTEVSILPKPQSPIHFVGSNGTEMMACEPISDDWPTQYWKLKNCHLENGASLDEVISGILESQHQEIDALQKERDLILKKWQKESDELLAIFSPPKRKEAPMTVKRHGKPSKPKPNKPPR